MTSGQFQEVDFDLLADYVGGALDGTAEQVLVEQLITAESQWRDAHQALVEAMAPVQDSLARLAAEQPVMPDDVAQRLIAVLDTTGPVVVPGGRVSPEDASTGSGRASHADRGESGQVPRSGGPVDTRTGVSTGPRSTDVGSPTGPRSTDVGSPTGPRSTDVGSPTGPRSTSPGSPTGPRSRKTRRRRWVRQAGPVAVVAVVLAFGVAGLTWLAPRDGGQSDSASTAGGAAVEPTTLPEQATDSAAGPRVMSQQAARQVLASGTDYTSATLLGALADLPRRAAAAEKSSSGPGNASAPDSTARTVQVPDSPDISDPPGAPGAEPVPTALRRLADRTALETCLAAVTAEHGRGQLSVQTVDYASFEGAPALIVVFTESAGERWAWVTGPDCGLPGSAADTRHLARVG